MVILSRKDVFDVLEMTTCNKGLQETFKNAGNQNFSIPKPMLCPHCLVYVDGVQTYSVLLAGNSEHDRIGVAAYQCTHCQKRFVVIYGIDFKVGSATFEMIYPSANLEFQDKRLEIFSPRFMTMYNQALQCEKNGNFELAAVGFRAALEILVKDYAIKELKIDSETVSGKILFNAIGEYLDEKPLVTSADVIRILGNDYAHYERKYPEHDFEILKEYMEIFIHLVGTKLRLAHPPVSRQGKNQSQPEVPPKVPSTE